MKPDHGAHHTSTDYKFAPIPEAMVYDPGINSNAMRVYAILARHGEDPHSCYPSHRRIGELSGLSPRSIPRLVKDLEEAGWVTIVRRWDEVGDPTSNGYHVHVERAGLRGVRAQERGPSTRGSGEGSTRGSAPKESNLNESQLTMDEDMQIQRDAPVFIAEVFFQLWNAWPPSKRYDREKCLAKFTTAMRTADATQALLKARALIAAKTESNEAKFIPDLSTWINQKRWEADMGTGAADSPSEFM